MGFSLCFDVLVQDELRHMHKDALSSFIVSTIGQVKININWSD